MKAFCFRNGVIQFGENVPRGALPIAEGPAKVLERIVTAVARWSSGGNDSVPLVPGIPEANNEDEAIAAYLVFFKMVNDRLEN